MLEDDEVRVDKAVTKEEEESGEFQRESSNMYVSVDIFQEFEHAKLVHCHYQRSLDLKIYLPNEAGEDSLLGGRRDIGGHQTEMRVLEISAAKGVKRGTNVEERIDG